MRRAIQRLIQDPLALKLINGDFHEGDTILVDVAPDGTLTFVEVGPGSTCPVSSGLNMTTNTVKTVRCSACSALSSLSEERPLGGRAGSTSASLRGGHEFRQLLLLR